MVLLVLFIILGVVSVRAYFCDLFFRNEFEKINIFLCNGALIRHLNTFDTTKLDLKFMYEQVSESFNFFEAAKCYIRKGLTHDLWKAHD